MKRQSMRWRPGLQAEMKKNVSRRKGMDIIQEQYARMGINKEIYEYGEAVLEKLATRFQKIDGIAEYNQMKVIKAMQDCQVSEACLLGTTGYGYNDLGRDRLEGV